MIEVDLLLRIAVAFLNDVDLEDFKKLVYETQFLIADINSFESDKVPKDSIESKKISKDMLSNEFRITKPRYEAEILLSHLLNITRTELHTNAKRTINDYNKQQYFKLLAMRKNGMPLEYLTNKASFYNIELYVDNNVLIPRQESEILVDKALEIIEKYNIKTFVEIGVGSGAISAAILKNTKNTNAIATDISKAAINIARHNMEAMNLTNRCELVESNLLQSPYMSSMNIQMLISNPPYIANNYPLNKEVLHEPHTALFGGKNGDEILKELLYQARQKEIPIILCEMGYDQRDSMSETLSGLGYDTEFYLDLSGLDRGFVAYIR